MPPYRDIDNDSGISAYEIGPDWIQVQFTTGGTYEYTYASVGSQNIEAMKRLAASGDGLNAYINRNVKKRYSRKIR